MRPIMEIEDILADVDEALDTYPSFRGRDALTLAAVIASLHESGSSMPENGFGLIFHRVVSRWRQRFDRAEACEALSIGFPFAWYEVDARHGCGLAAETFKGRRFTEPDNLPVLPLDGCDRPHCRCWLRGVTGFRRGR